MSEEAAKAKLVAPDYQPRGEFSTSFDTSEAGNPRLRLNLPADAIFFQIVEQAGNPPVFVVVCHAHQELVALGVLEKAKIEVMNFQRKLQAAKASLVEGVRDAAGLDLTKIAGRA